MGLLIKIRNNGYYLKKGNDCLVPVDETMILTFGSCPNQPNNTTQNRREPNNQRGCTGSSFIANTSRLHAAYSSELENGWPTLLCSMPCMPSKYYQFNLPPKIWTDKIKTDCCRFANSFFKWDKNKSGRTIGNRHAKKCHMIW